MQIELSDPAYVDSLRTHLQHAGCPSEQRGEEVVEVRVLWSPERPLTDAEQRAKVVGHPRVVCGQPGVKANILS